MATVPGAPVVQPRPLTQSQQLEFFWSAPLSDGGDPITSYVITDGTTSNTLVDAARWYRATGLVNGTVYQYRVAASNSIGLGPYSFFRAVQPGLPPGLPTNVSYSNIDGLRYEISWINPTDTGQASLQRGFIQAFPLDGAGNTLSTSTYSSFIVARSVWGGNAGDSNQRILELFSNYNYKVLVRVMNDPGFSLPITYTSTIFTAPFSPDGIAALRLWLDATNSSNFTLSSTQFVSTWTDKSPNAYQVSQTTASNFPTFSTNFVSFSTFQYLNLPQAAINNVSTWTMMFYFVPRDTYAFINAKQHDANNTYNLISYGATTNSSGAVVGGISTTLYLHTSNAGSTINYPIGFPTNTINLVEMRYDGQSNLSLWNNGFLWSSIRGDFRFADVTSATNGTLGALIQSNTFRLPSTSAFSLGSMLFYSSIIEASTMYKLQGYLSWQYGLQSNLPTNHPYYSVQPTSVDTQLEFSPSTISSMQLWLDMSDPSYFSTSAGTSSIERWYDRSGNGYDAIQFESSQSVYLPTGLSSGKPTMFLQPGSTMIAAVPRFTFASTVTAFVVFEKTGAANSFEALVTRTVGNIPAPFDMYNNTRVTGSGGPSQTFGTSFNIQTATSLNVFSFTQQTGVIWDETWQGSTTQLSRQNNQYGDVASSIFIATRQNKETYFRGNMSEILFYSSTLTFGERKAVEGHLAWKWGAQSSLALYHPFRFQPPVATSLYSGCNGAFSFDILNNSTIVVPTDSDLQVGSNDFTMEWWQWIAPTASDYVLGFGTKTGATMFITAEGTGKAARLWFNTTAVGVFTLPNSIPNLSSSWHHIAIVRSNGVARCFYDGMSSPTSLTYSSNISSSVYNLHLGYINYRGYIHDFQFTNGTALYWSSNFSPLSSLQSNASTVLLLKPQTLGRATQDFGPLNKKVFDFSPVNWTPNYYPNFVQSFGTQYNPGGRNFQQIAIDDDLRFRTSSFTIEFYYNGLTNSRPWGLNNYPAGPGATETYFDCEFSGTSIALRWDNGFPPAFNVSYTLVRNAFSNWNHYAITRDVSTIRVFQNGVQLGISRTSALDFNPTTVPWRVGSQSNYDGNGYITNFHIVKGVALYTSSFTPPTIPIQSNANTVLLLNFTSTLAVDNGPLNKTVSTLGSPSWYFATNTRP